MVCLMRAVAGGCCTAMAAVHALVDGMSSTHCPTALHPQTSAAQHLPRPQRRQGAAARAPRPDWHLLSSCGAHAHTATGGGAPPPSGPGAHNPLLLMLAVGALASQHPKLPCSAHVHEAGWVCSAVLQPKCNRSAAASEPPTSPRSPLDPAPTNPAALLITLLPNLCTLQGLAGRPVLYRGTLDCIRQVLRTEGIKGFYAASLPSYLKVGGAAGLG